MKKLVLLLLVLLSIFSLTACGQQEESTEEFKPNYAINDTKDPSTEEEFFEEPTTQLPTTSTDAEITTETENNTTSSLSFSYPTLTDPSYYLNLVKIAETSPFGFVFNDISVNITDGKDMITEVSNSNKIFCQGYSSNLQLVDTDILSTTDYNLCRLAMIAPAIDYIQLGSYQYELNELLYNTDNFENMIKMFSINYTIVPPSNSDGTSITYDENDIYSYAIESIGNNYGPAYTWTFSWINDNEYTEEELSIIKNKCGEIPPNIITIYADYNTDNTLVYYTITVKKAAHFWVEEITYSIPNEEVISAEDGTVSENIINETEIGTGTYNCFQDGYYFSDGYIKMIDESYIGLNTIEITIHNHSCKNNRNKSFDYIIE